MRKELNNIKFALYQMNTVTGDLDGNFDKAKSFIQKSLNYADIIVLPETAIASYCCGALWDNIDFVKEQEEKTKELANLIPPEKCLIIGYVSFYGMKKNGLPKMKNSVLVINQDNHYVYDKQYLASDNHQEDKRYFEPGKESKVFEITIKPGTFTIGTPICEDIWYMDHNRDIPKEMIDKGAELIVNINQSYFYYGKQEIRKELITRFDTPFIYLNSCGVGDIVKNVIIFDGSSLIWDGDNKVKTIKRFEECEVYTTLSKEHDVNYDYTKYDEIIDALIFTQKEFFKLCGLEKAQVHLSGGIDSSIVAPLVVEAMGKDNTIFITNPSDLSSESIKLAIYVAEKLDVKLWENPVQSIYDEILRVDSESFEGMELSDVGKSTIQALVRTVQGFYNCHRFKSGIVNTGNHTEIALSWYNTHDIGSSGVYQMIGDLSKMELYELAEHINKRFDMTIIPPELFNGEIKPAAELPDAMEDPIDYYIQSGLCIEIIRYNKTKTQIINEYLNRNLNKEFFLTLKIKAYMIYMI